MAGQFKIENYLAGALIQIEGKQDSDNFYIIRQGKVKIYRETPVQAEGPYTILGPGDFFGVTSCMSGHARLESATAVENASLISVSRDMFGTLIQKNPAVAMKIIRFFSRKLRLFDKAISTMSFSNDSLDSPAHLFEVGSYYTKNKQTATGIYALQKFIRYCPHDLNVNKAISILQSLNAPLMAEESEKTMNRTYHDNEMIFSESEPGEELFIIQTGKVKITKIVKDEILLAVLKPGDIFGEMALLDNKARSASAISFGETKVLAINRTNFETLVQIKPQIATKLIQLLSERIWTAYRQLENLMITSDIARIFDTLLIQIEKQKIPLTPKTPHNFDIGTKELINMVGLSPERGEAAIPLFLSNKNIKIDQGKISCRDIRELDKTVTFYKKQALMEAKREENRKKNY